MVSGTFLSKCLNLTIQQPSLKIVLHKVHGYIHSLDAETDVQRRNDAGIVAGQSLDGTIGIPGRIAFVIGEIVLMQQIIVALIVAKEDPRVCAITAAMPGGTGLLGFRNAYPDRLFDVGIAEEHAVSMAGGLAKQGAKPVVAIYSTFFQRSYDQIMQDIALLRLPVVLAVDRAGMVGEDGPTHHGVFDVGFLRQGPGMTVLCPASHQELSDMLRWAVLRCGAPVAVRYPRGSEGAYKSSAFACDPSGVCVHREGSDVTLITYGNLINNVIAAAELLEARGVSVKVLRLLSVTHIPDLLELVSGEVVVVEEAAEGSGIKEAIAWKLNGRRVYGIDLGADFVPHGDQNSLYKFTGLDAGSITKFVCEVLHHEK